MTDNTAARTSPTDVDVIVIGSGFAGTCAALSAAEQGATVFVAEGKKHLGGSSAFSGGQMMATGSHVQRELGVEDSADDMYRFYMAGNRWELSPTIVRTLVDNSGPSIDWLAKQGVRFEPRVLFSGEEFAPRDHVPDQSDGPIVRRLHSAAAAHERIDLATGQRVERLIIEDKRIAGVVIDGEAVRSSAVVIATGGFGANPELLERYFPRAWAAGDWLWYIGTSGARGDAFALADQVGAQIVGHNRGGINSTPAFDRGLEVYMPGWLIAVNARGQRFFDETASYATTQAVFGSQPGPVHVIFDEVARRNATVDSIGDHKRVVLPGSNPTKWTGTRVSEGVSEGTVVKANTIEELAERIGVPTETLRGTVDRYNDGAAQGCDPDFAKAEKFLHPIAEPPYYASEIRLAHVSVTSTGLRIDQDARVIGTSGSPLPGLYAAGECTGGVLGEVYMGSGNSVANCVVFGRIAGANAGTLAIAAKAGA